MITGLHEKWERVKELHTLAFSLSLFQHHIGKILLMKAFVPQRAILLQIKARVNTISFIPVDPVCPKSYFNI